MRTFFALLAAILVALVSVLGFRGQTSEKPPLWIFPDMDNQAKYKAQAYNDYFDNRMNDRPKPLNTVIRGQGWERGEVFAADFSGAPLAEVERLTGKDANGEWVTGYPVAPSETLMRLGEEKYSIFCLPCHGHVGDGKGVTSEYGVLAANLNLEMFREQPNGQIYQTIAWGKGTMYGYAEKLSPEERWAVVLYVRALQRSQWATAEDVPADKKAEVGL